MDSDGVWQGWFADTIHAPQKSRKTYWKLYRQKCYLEYLNDHIVRFCASLATMLTESFFRLKVSTTQAAKPQFSPTRARYLAVNVCDYRLWALHNPLRVEIHPQLTRPGTSVGLESSHCPEQLW